MKLKDCNRYTINTILQLFHDSTTISMVCRILVRQPSKEAHGHMGIDLLMDLLLFARAKSSSKLPSGAVKEASQYVDKRSSESSNKLWLLFAFQIENRREMSLLRYRLEVKLGLF